MNYGFVTKLRDYFFEMCKDLHFVVPNLPAMVEPTPASALKLITLDEWPDQIPLANAGYFVVIHVDKFERNFPLTLENTINKLRRRWMSCLRKWFESKY